MNYEIQHSTASLLFVQGRIVADDEGNPFFRPCNQYLMIKTSTILILVIIKTFYYFSGLPVLHTTPQKKAAGPGLQLKVFLSHFKIYNHVRGNCRKKTKFQNP